MNVCACKTKTSQEGLSMCQNAQQHDTGIDPLVLQMLLPLHSLHLLLCHWCSQMLLLIQLCTRYSATVACAVCYTVVYSPLAH